MTDFPDLMRDPALPGSWYAGSLQPSIYSSHIHHAVEQCVLSVFRVSTLTLRSRNRVGPVALARQIAMYLAHVALGLSFTEIGRLFSRDRTTVAHGCGVIEGLRDNPRMDRALTMLERAVVISKGNPDAPF